MTSPKKMKFPYEEENVPLLDWTVLRNPHLQRWKYSVAHVSQYMHPNISNCPINEVILNYLYSNSTPCPSQRCQRYLFFGIEGYGSIVCEDCLPAARYALFSLCNPAYINKIHVHVSNVLDCQHCNRRIASSSISRCVTNRNEGNIILIEPKYRCMRVNNILDNKDI